MQKLNTDSNSNIVKVSLAILVVQITIAMIVGGLYHLRSMQFVLQELGFVIIRSILLIIICSIIYIPIFYLMSLFIHYYSSYKYFTISLLAFLIFTVIMFCLSMFVDGPIVLQEQIIFMVSGSIPLITLKFWSGKLAA